MTSPIVPFTTLSLPFHYFFTSIRECTPVTGTAFLLPGKHPIDDDSEYRHNGNEYYYALNVHNPLLKKSNYDLHKESNNPGDDTLEDDDAIRPL